MFGRQKNKTKTKTEKDLKAERDAFAKEQRDSLLALRVNSELKIEKSAIITLSQISDVVRSQAIINKVSLQKVDDLKNNNKAIMSELIKFSKTNFKDVDTMKAHLKVLIDRLSED